MNERRALTRETAKRYRKASKAGKTLILNEYVQNTGYNRKYAITVLFHEDKSSIRSIGGKRVKLTASHKTKAQRVYQKYYDEPVQKALLLIWEFFNFMCGKRLIPLVRENLTSLAKAKRFGVEGEVKAKLAAISISTAERLFKRERKKQGIKGSHSTRKGSLLKNQIPIRVFFDWDERLPGFFEIDTVSHDGGVVSGEYCFTLTITDVFSGWTELKTLKNKAHRWVRLAMDELRTGLPFPMKGIDSDNGGEFINDAMLAWSIEHRIQFTRSRSYRKNDNCLRHECRVEQKNLSAVRNTVGYCRFEGDAALSALSAVYDAFCPLLNFFYPCSKLISKERTGSKVKKTYENAKTPFSRLMERADTDPQTKRELLRRKAAFDVVKQQLKLEAARQRLMKLASRFEPVSKS
jgi:hypothetical protein